eukprot:2569616-Pleurochrysis_carterae.AAC.4
MDDGVAPSTLCKEHAPWTALYVLLAHTLRPTASFTYTDAGTFRRCHLAAGQPAAATSLPQLPCMRCYLRAVLRARNGSEGISTRLRIALVSASSRCKAEYCTGKSNVNHEDQPSLIAR